MEIIDLGRIGYQDAVAVQLERLQAVAEGGEEALFVLEHPPVVTLGRHGGGEHLLVSPEALAREGVELVQSSRGGSITCHFPGQVVAYPVCRLAGRSGGLKGFVSLMESAGIAWAARFGVAASRSEGRPGVWVGQRKLASIGIALKRWVTWHGIALNVTRDLWLFDRITLCGLPDARATSLEIERGEPVDMSQAKQAFCEEFVRVFGQVV